MLRFVSTVPYFCAVIAIFFQFQSMAMESCCHKPDTCLQQNDESSMDTSLQKLEQMLVQSIQALQPDVNVEGKDVISMVRLVYNSMTTRGRVYHAMQHIFDISVGMKDPIQILAALFHDVVYYSIDKAFLDEQQRQLDGIILIEDDWLALSADLNGDELIQKYVHLFGFTPGAPLPKSGTNEFISGMIGVKVLSKFLSTPQLLQIAACIEATIPFRPVLDGKTPMARLYDRLKLTCPEQSEEWLVATMKHAVLTTNFDLCSFDSDDRDFFLDSSWKLIPEARPALLEDGCSLIEWHNELKALEGRTKFLMGAVDKIFQRFGDFPSDEEMAEKKRKTRENLSVMWEYTKVRQLQAMILVAAVEALGEDAASTSMRSCLTMDVPGFATARVTRSLTPVEQEVRNWLVSGRRTCFDWDPAICPLGAYLFDSIGTQGIDEAIEIGKKNERGSHELLKHLPKTVVLTVSSRLGAVFTDRAESFSQVSEKIGIMA